MKHRTVRGYIRYATSEGGESGREWFTITVHGNGHRTFRTMIEYDQLGMLRDVTHTCDERFRPLDAFVRQTKHDRFMGAMWFRFSEHLAEAEGYTAGEGRLSQRWPTTVWTPILCSHSLIADFWHAAAFDLDGPKRQEVRGRLSTSEHPLGDSGPRLCIGLEPNTIAETAIMEYGGEHRITVAAGTFDCIRVDVVRRQGPPVEFYTTRGDYLPILCKADFVGSRYELVELR
ncbi:MAG: hypothetical protein FJX65_09790 [Alphaproteobacteria bacterium]|nr:hypothetical protein [Alphaproteobacteria bacterium]